MTFDDLKAYTKPFTVRIPHTLLADADIFEMFDENEKDCAHIRSRISLDGRLTASGSRGAADAFARCSARRRFVSATYCRLSSPGAGFLFCPCFPPTKNPYRNPHSRHGSNLGTT